LKFKRYNSIENSYKGKYIEKIRDLGYDRESYEWMVTEKVHGANFSFVCDGKTVECQKRTSILIDESFFNWKSVKEKYEEKILKMFRTFTNIKELYVFGELIGGNYPHKEVTPNNNSTQVQKGIYYTPDNEFIAFDVFALMNDDSASWVDSEAVIGMCNFLSIPHVPFLFKGTLDECLNYSNEFQTKVPSMLNLPEIEDNICEGVVIKPVNPLYMRQERIIIKNKNEKWTDKARKPKKPRQTFVLSDLQQKWINEYTKYLTKARFASAMSKIGEPDFKLFGQFIKEVSTDAFKDFMDDCSAEMNADLPESSERSVVTKAFGKLNAEFVREMLRENM